MSAPGRRARWRSEVRDVLRGLAGALLFGVPFLYTQEMWTAGQRATIPTLVASVGLGAVALLALDAFSGFHWGRRWRAPRQVALDTVEGVAIAGLAAVGGLALLGQLQLSEGPRTAIGQVVLLSLPLAIGVGIANSFLVPAGRGRASAGERSGESRWRDHGWHGTAADLGATVLGAAILSGNIAPTEEVGLIAQGLTTSDLTLVAVVSLVLSYVVVFEADFGSQAARRAHPGILQSPVSETLVCYGVSLLTALLLLWLLRVLDAGDPTGRWVGHTIVLGLPATMGGAAGRLLAD